MADYKEMNGNSIKKLFKERIDEMQKEATEKKTLFDYRCAKLDFEDMLSKKISEFDRSGGQTNPEINVKLVEEFDLKPYTKTERFKMIGTSPYLEKSIIAGVSIDTVTGNWENYVCKHRGCGISILKLIVKAGDKN